MILLRTTTTRRRRRRAIAISSTPIARRDGRERWDGAAGADATGDATQNEAAAAGCDGIGTTGGGDAGSDATPAAAAEYRQVNHP